MEREYNKRADMGEHVDQELSPARLPAPVVEKVADRFRLLGDPTRLRLVNEMHTDGELSVGALVDRVGMSYGAVSKQLALLRSHGIVSRRREGTRIYYQISDPTIADLCTVVCQRIRDDWSAWGVQLESQLSGVTEDHDDGEQR